MPRIARKSIETSFFHIIVQGVNKEYIFDTKQFIEYYIDLIHKYKPKYKLEIMAYCIMNNHAHLLIFCEHINEMSKFMHQINSLFAQKYNKTENRVGHVFRNRYLSQAIYSERYLINCIHYIHNNPVKANIVNKCEEYEYSTYRDYIRKIGVAESQIVKDIIGECNFKDMILDDNEIFLDIDVTHDEIMQKVILKVEKDTKKKLNEILNETNIARHLIQTLKQQYGITYKEMQKKLKISERTLDRLK